VDENPYRELRYDATSHGRGIVSSVKFFIENDFVFEVNTLIAGDSIIDCSNQLGHLVIDVFENYKNIIHEKLKNIKPPLFPDEIQFMLSIIKRYVRIQIALILHKRESVKLDWKRHGF
jgi:hypothetical protein